MPRLETIDVWEADKAIDLADWTIGVVSGLLRPSFQAVLLSSAGDVLTLQVSGPRQPSGERSALFHVAGRGTFELVRLERWPAAPGGGGERVLLTLRVWPRP
ncbi:MAG: hypothetical protein IPO09_17690 [Anaeromyxobacter sp.]|nr:hypothetical protein [Anaeromyxobacter sp.]MBL0276467.1 hypothetical protein [Anaeromyxobacter sp.]